MVKTINPHTWFTVTNDAGESQTVYNDETPQHDYPIEFEVNFSDSTEPQSNTVTLHNMSKEHRDFYKKGQKCVLSFNWGKTRKNLCEGIITKIGTTQHNGVDDSQVITFTEGTDYTNVKARRMQLKKNKKVNNYKHITKTETYKSGKKKGQKHKVTKRVKTRPTNKTIYVNRVFKKGTTYKALIQGIAKASGIKIAKIQLVKNPKLKRPFTAKQKPLTLLKQVVKKTGSKIIYERGKLTIVNPKSAKRSWVQVDDQDLIAPPTSNQSDADEKATTWEITIPLMPDITINTGIEMKSKYLKGKFYVKAGQHTFDGSNPQTQCSLIKM